MGWGRYRRGEGLRVGGGMLFDLSGVWVGLWICPISIGDDDDDDDDDDDYVSIYLNKKLKLQQS